MKRLAEGFLGAVGDLVIHSCVIRLAMQTNLSFHKGVRHRKDTRID